MRTGIADVCDEAKRREQQPARGEHGARGSEDESAVEADRNRAMIEFAQRMDWLVLSKAREARRKEKEQ